MGDATGGKKGKGMFSWLIGNVFRPGWRRWLIFVIALAVFLILVSFLRGGVDYKRDPGALVSRNALFYLEAKNIDAAMRNAGMWSLWNDERRAAGDEQWNHIQALLAGAISDKVHGLGSRLPLGWLTSSDTAALAVLEPVTNGQNAWILFVKVPNPQTSVKELRQEPGVTVSPYREANNLFEITGNDNSTLSVATVGPWLVVSSSFEPLLFAAEAVRRPGVSLSSSLTLPNWRGDGALRGMLDPKFALADTTSTAPLARLVGWMEKDSRFVFSIKTDKESRLQVDGAFAKLGETKSDTWLWSFIKFILKIVALLCLLLAAAIILVMLGWGGWLKTLAVKTGIHPKDKPKNIEPSEAFKEDAGVAVAGSAAEPSPDDPIVPPNYREPRTDTGSLVNPMQESDVDFAPAEPIETFPETIDVESIDPLAGHLLPEDNPDGEETATAEPDTVSTTEEFIGEPVVEPVKSPPRPRKKPAKSEEDNQDSVDVEATVEEEKEEDDNAEPPRSRRRLPRRKKSDDEPDVDEQ